MNSRSLEKSFLFNVIFFLTFLYFFPLHAMEKHISGYWSDEAHEQELLLPKQEKKKKEETQDDSVIFRKGDCLLKKLDPEITAYIFSFLPADGKDLNTVMRWDGFQPKTNPVEASPFYAVVERIRNAHSNYIFKRCEQSINRFAYDRDYGVFSLMCSFMRTTKYKENKKNTFFWSDVHELNALISDHVSAQELGANEEQLKDVLHRFVAETEERYYTSIYFNSGKKMRSHDFEPRDIYHFARQRILAEFKERLRSNQDWYDYDEEMLHGCCEGVAPRWACGCSLCCLLSTGLTAFFCGVHAPIGYIVGTGAMNIVTGFCASASLGRVAWERKIYYEQKPGRDKVWQSYLLLSDACEELQDIGPLKKLLI